VIDPTAEPGRAVSAARAHLERGFRFEQGGTLERALEAYRDALSARATPIEEAEARLRIARVYRTMAEWQHSRDESREAVRLATEHGADDLAAEAMNIEIGALQMQGFFAEAERMALIAVDRAQSPRVKGITLQNLGRGAAEQRDFATSDRYFELSIAAFRTAGYEVGLAVALTNAARVALDRGDAARSVEIGHEGIAIARRTNALDVLLTAVQNQAAAFVAMHDLESAESLLTEALGHFTSARNPVRQAECLEIMGQMSELKSDPDTSVRCYTRARDLATAANDLPLVERLTNRIASAEAAKANDAPS
jgi:tetratricopeptide (TPR) repeat protein